MSISAPAPFALPLLGWGHGPRRAATAFARRGAGPFLLMSGSAAFQVSAALSVPVFASAGVLGTSGLRFAVGAAVLLAAVRPRLRGRSRADWAWISALGLTVAMMNALSYETLHRLPLGTATTLEFLGPLGVAIAASRTAWHLACAVVAGVGVVLIAGPSVHAAPAGLLFGALTALAFAGYIVLTDRVGSRTPGFEGLSLSITVAALATLPFSVSGAAALHPADIGRVALSGAVGIALAYLLDLMALRRTGPRAAGVLLSLEPALGAMVGLLLLSQHLSGLELAGLLVVVVAGAATSATTDPRVCAPP